MATPAPIQPPDETPLNISGVTLPDPQILQNIPIIKSDIEQTHASVLTDMQTDAKRIVKEYDDARAEIVAAALSDIGTIESNIVDNYATVMKSADRTLNKIGETYDNQYADLFVNGVQTPNGIEQMMNDLIDPSGDAFTQRYSGLPPPIRPIDDTTPDVVPVYNCPVGTHAVLVSDLEDITGIPDGFTYICVPDEPAPDEPITSDPVPVRPVTGDPPPIRPTPVNTTPVNPTPVNPTPSVVTVDPCDAPNIETVQVACYTLPVQPITLKYWITVDCEDCNKPKVCVHMGLKPPTNYVGILQPGVYDVQPTEAMLKGLAIQCVKAITGIDPTVPPISPPTSPPTTPDDATDTPLPACDPDDMEVVGDAIALADTSASATCVAPASGSTTPRPIITMEWSNVKACKTAHDNYINKLEKTVNEGESPSRATTAARATNILQTFSYAYPPLNALSALFSTLKPDEAKGQFTDLINDITGVTTDAVVNTIYSLPSWNVPNRRAAALIGSGLAIADRVQKITGFPLDYVMTGERYSYQYANPQYIPSQSEINGMYLMNKVDLDSWTCYTRANGNIVELAKLGVESQQIKPNVNELIQLYQRGWIKDVKTLNDRLREDGVIDTVYADELLKLATATPGFDDVIRMMVRDTFDPETVKKYGMDDEFKEKYTEYAKKLGEAVGLTEDIAKQYWRIHWHTPSDTSLYTMIHQLNPGRPEVTRWEKLKDEQGEAVAIARYGNKPESFTEEDLKYALKINDNLPTFVDKLVAIQYRPITNTDASRMYELGYTDDEQFKWAIVKNGYTETDAKSLVDFYKAQRTKRLSNDTGVWTGRKIMSAFKDGLIDKETADELLAEKIVDPELRKKTLSNALFEMETDTKRIKYKALRKKYMYGQYSDQFLSQELETIGITPTAIRSIVERWRAEKLGRAREPRVAALCKWFNNGYITYADYFARLELMGYGFEDIARIVATCTNENAARQAKLAMQAADRNRRESERLLREQKQSLSETLKKLQADIKAAEQRYADILAAVGYNG